MDTALRGQLRELKQLSGLLTRIKRSAALRRLPAGESRRIRTQIGQLLLVLQAVVSVASRSDLSSARLARLRTIVRAAGLLRDALETAQTKGSMAKWLPLLIRVARDLSFLRPAPRVPEPERAHAAPSRKARASAPPRAAAKKNRRVIRARKLKIRAPEPDAVQIGARRAGLRARAAKRAAARKKSAAPRKKLAPRPSPPAPGASAPIAAFGGLLSHHGPLLGAVAGAVAGDVPSVGDDDASLPVDATLDSGRAPRYANSTVLDGSGRRLERTESLSLGQVIRLRIDIGALSADSHVSGGAAFPDEAVSGDVDLDVMVSSTDFAVQGDGIREGDSTVAHGRFFLPENGDPAIASDGTPFIHFQLTAPAQEGTARCRIGFYYRNTLLQSQQLTAAIGRFGGFDIVTDFTVSRDLTALARIPDRPRLSVLTNLNQEGMHQIVLRALDPHSAAIQARTFVINQETVGPTVAQIRTALAARAPASKQRRRSELIQDLKQLAQHGWTLYTQMAAQNLDALSVLLTSPADYVVQILRPTTSGFVIPWALMYEIPLLSDKPDVCPLVSAWRDTDKLIEGAPRNCPHGPHAENVLCPFGFWGFRYAIEQLSSSEDPVLEIQAFPKSTMVVAETQFQVDFDELETHVTALRTVLQKALPTAALEEGKDKKTIRTLLGQDLPLVYFFCHGQQRNVADPDTYLAVGKKELLTAKEVIGWIVSWRRENKVVWNKVRPLIFVNACHSLAVYPATLVSYLDAFVGIARAAGVIGTEVKVNPVLASRFAERFFELLLTESNSVEVALRTIRFEYLAAGNLFGLVYTPYCWADLKVTRAQ